MAEGALELADRLWRGEASVTEHHPVSGHLGLEEVAPGTAFVASFGNISAFATDGRLVLVDTGTHVLAATNHADIRRWTDLPLEAVVYRSEERRGGKG